MKNESWFNQKVGSHSGVLIWDPRRKTLVRTTRPIDSDGDTRVMQLENFPECEGGYVRLSARANEEYMTAHARTVRKYASEYNHLLDMEAFASHTDDASGELLPEYNYLAGDRVIVTGTTSTEHMRAPDDIDDIVLSQGAHRYSGVVCVVVADCAAKVNRRVQIRDVSHRDLHINPFITQEEGDFESLKVMVNKLKMIVAPNQMRTSNGYKTRAGSIFIPTWCHATNKIILSNGYSETKVKASLARPMIEAAVAIPEFLKDKAKSAEVPQIASSE